MRIDASCFTVELEVSSSSDKAIDITNEPNTHIDLANNKIEFMFTSDDLDRYCYKLWDHP